MICGIILIIRKSGTGRGIGVRQSAIRLMRAWERLDGRAADSMIRIDILL
jgi:hypothetical protein